MARFAPHGSVGEAESPCSVECANIPTERLIAELEQRGYWIRKGSQPEPMAFAVYMPRGHEYDYMLFADRNEACDEASLQCKIPMKKNQKSSHLFLCGTEMV